MKAIVVAALAGHRAARAVAADSITDPVRDCLYIWTAEAPDDRSRRRREWLAGDPGKGSEKVGLVNCPHCCGFWLTAIALAAYVTARRRGWRSLQRAVEVWAAAGIQSTLTSLQGRADDPR